MYAYPDSDDRRRASLLEQKTCPLAENLWEKRANEEAFKQKRAKQSESDFLVISRDATELERKEHPSAVIMTHAVHGDVIVPDVVLRPLHRISYLDLVRKVLAANPTKDLDMFILCELWDALLTKVYYYEFNWRELKKVEGRTADYPAYKQIVEDVAALKKRKHSEIEEGSKVSDPSIIGTKRAKGSEKATKALESSSSSDAPQTETKANEKIKTSRALEASNGSHIPTSTTKAQAPATALEDAPARSANRAPTKGKAPSNAPSPSVAGQRTPLGSSGTLIPPPARPYNAAPDRPRPTGPHAAHPSSLRRVQPPPLAPPPPPSPPPARVPGLPPYTERELRLLGNWIPITEYDPVTGKKSKVGTGWKPWRV